MSGKTWATIGFWLGITTSIAANIEHAHLVSGAFGALLTAAFWPVALLISLEVITRVSWPPGQRWAILRWCGLTTVALIAALASYAHMAALLGTYDEGWLARIEPLAVDGLMVVCSTALLAISDNTKRRPVIGEVSVSSPLSRGVS